MTQAGTYEAEEEDMVAKNMATLQKILTGMDRMDKEQQSHQIETPREPLGAALRIVGWKLEMNCGDRPPNEGCTTRGSPSPGALQMQKMYRYSKEKQTF